MAKNYVAPGDTIPWTNSTGASVASGQLVKAGHIAAVALTTIANGATGTVAIEGIFDVPKVSAAVFVIGEKLLLDVSANGGLGAFDDSAATPASGDLMGAAIAVNPGLNTQTTCRVKLTPGNATLTA
jgi:predicted RecA/RadA family phage recombinase